MNPEARLVALLIVTIFASQTVEASIQAIMEERGMGRAQIVGVGIPTWLSVGSRKALASVEKGKVKPHVVVAKDGRSRYKNISAGLGAYPRGHKSKFIIHVKAGTYREYVTVESQMKNVFMYGDGPDKTIITGNRSMRYQFPPNASATFSVFGDGFIAKWMTFQNTAGPEGDQAVALRVHSEKSAFFGCRMDGYQDTLYVKDKTQFYRECVILGSIDFIFGENANCVIQNSRILVKTPKRGQENVVTAQGRGKESDKGGIVIHNCTIERAEKLSNIKAYLGRPWKNFSRTITMESDLGDVIDEQGWREWGGKYPVSLDTITFREYKNRGKTANSKRVKWKGYKKIEDDKEALQYTVGAFIDSEKWLKHTGVPFLPGLLPP